MGELEKFQYFEKSLFKNSKYFGGEMDEGFLNNDEVLKESSWVLKSYMDLVFVS